MNLAQEVADAADKLRSVLGPRWPLKLIVPRAVSPMLRVHLELCGITVHVDRNCAHDHWYLVDGVKR